MPHATRRRHEDLNRAYTHVPKDNITDAVLAMRDKLAVGLGFEERETQWAVQTNIFTGADDLSDGLFEAKEPAINFDTIAKPNFESLSEDDKKIVSEAVEVRRKNRKRRAAGIG